MNLIQRVSIVACSQLLVIGVSLAQQPRSAEEFEPGTVAAPPKPRATTAEKKAAKVERKEEGAQAARDDIPMEGNPVPDSNGRVGHEERKEAAAHRRTETTKANKAGEIVSPGELEENRSASGAPGR